MRQGALACWKCGVSEVSHGCRKAAPGGRPQLSETHRMPLVFPQDAALLETQHDRC